MDMWLLAIMARPLAVAFVVWLHRLLPPPPAMVWQLSDTFQISEVKAMALQRIYVSRRQIPLDGGYFDLCVYRCWPSFAVCCVHEWLAGRPVLQAVTEISLGC